MRLVMLNAYVIGNITIKDENKWSQYRSKVAETLRPWGGELVFRGVVSEVLVGEIGHTDNVVIGFPDMESLDGWFNSEKYQSLVTIRNKAAQMDLVSYQAGS
jgi:uncharacterized protein (DUF1330 family)